ncbi:hypothetical protein CUT44_06465 [Streptomyces carminius]|uniref:DUF3099 domain-containing protein n=1 Tax=Streptomyces carminius TaxID=2665496 RepID=A0A2M8M2D1_9ACTN|nr:DUF3099 domain-containing protein [Streptomyces carminius]PJE98359.1 hypothetical protein CUT44_06465 [Streptomyces carminius]
MRHRQHGPQVFRITGARQGLDEDVRGRQRRYVAAMLVRTAAVLLTVLLWNVQRPLAVLALVLGALLPYVAVVVANAGRENAPPAPASLLPAPPRTALGHTEHTEYTEPPEPRSAGEQPYGREAGGTARETTHRQEPSRPGPERRE